MASFYYNYYNSFHFSFLGDTMQRARNKHGADTALIFILLTVNWIKSNFPLENHTICGNVKAFIRSVCKKVTSWWIHHFACFSSSRENPVKCSACVVKQKIETGNFDVFVGNLLISNEPLDRILRNLAGKYFSQQVNGLSQKI